MKEHSWVCTLVTRIFLCSVLFIAINIGQAQKHVFDKKAQSRPLDVLFMSVVGGYRPLEEQILLLKTEVAKVYKAQFVVSISELGEEDPLTHNGPPTVAREHQLLWLTKTLEESISEWCIIVGFHPLSACNGSMQGKENFEDLQHMFLRYGVIVYMSRIACDEYVPKGGATLLSVATQMEKGPYLTSVEVDMMAVHHEEQINGFLLHRVSSLEFVAYFVNLKGEVVQRTGLQQRGKEVT